ncbi:MAG: NYN domain-containing protein [Acidimicrobiales bacterium]
MRYVVDGMNVIGSRPDGWWRDRPGARRALVADLADLAGAGDEVTVVFDGRPTADEAEGPATGVVVRFAPGGPNAADDAIVELLRRRDDPHQLVVVTSDEALAGRVRELGARVLGAHSFRNRMAR